MAARAGLLTVTLHVPGSQTLKDKRQVVRSLLDRVRHGLHLSAAETGSLDNHRRAELGVSAVSNDGRQVAAMLDKALELIQSEPRAEVEEHEIELY